MSLSAKGWDIVKGLIDGKTTTQEASGLSKREWRELMEALGGGRTSYVLLMAIYAALVYDVISATNSSPQTTEINAGTRPMEAANFERLKQKIGMA